MFTKDELRLIYMVVGNRAYEVEEHIKTHNYEDQFSKMQDELYAKDLYAIAEKCDKAIQE